MYLKEDFFNRPVLEVAEDLIGARLIKDGRALTITELEAYDGPNDLACHASKGCTKRTRVMYGAAGVFYVYLCYGMYWMLNIVTGPAGYPAALLIRGAGDFNGPGKLTKALGIDGSYNGLPATPKTGLYFAPPETRPHKKLIQTAPRIGVSYAGPVWANKPYRYLLTEGKPKSLGIVKRQR